MIDQAANLEQEIARLQAELARQQRYMALLRDVALASRGGVEPREMFQTIYEQLAQILPIDAFFVALLDREGAPEYRFALTIDEGQHYELDDIRVGGLTGFLLEHGQPLLFGDLHAEYVAPNQPPQVFGLNKPSRAWMGVPIRIGRETMGVLSAQSYQAGVFDGHDLNLLQALGDLAALAIENAMLYRAQDDLSQSLAERVTARSEEVAVLTSVAISFSQGQPLPVLLEEVLERVLWLLGMHGGAILLHERPTLLHRVATRGTVGNAPEWLHVDGESREAQALRHQQLVELMQSDQMLLVLPLRAHGTTVGVMTLYGPPRPLTEHERSLVEAAGYQIGVGVENARLLSDRERQIAQLEALAQIAATTSATLDLRTMFDQVRQITAPLLAFDGFWGGTYDAIGQVLLDGVAWHSDKGAQPIDQIGLHPNWRIARIVRERGALLLRHTDPLHYQLPPQQSWEAEALSWLGVPLLGRDGQSIGVLAVQSQRPDAFEPRDVQFLSAVATQLALNVENAQLYTAARLSATIAEQRADNLALVHSMSRLVNSSLDPQQVLGITAQELVKLFGVDHCGVALYNGRGWIGEVVAEYPALGVQGQQIAFRNVDDFANDMQHVGQPIFVADVRHDPRTQPVRALAEQYGMHSMLIVPLISRGRAVGALALNMRDPRRAFAPDEIELCHTIAAQVAIALENARLYQQSVTRVEQELEIARSIQLNLFPKTLPTIPAADLDARCVPAHETGGDFYDVLPLGDARFGIVVGDVSGKSLPAAMLMAVARSIVRSEALDHVPPDEVLRQTNVLVAQDVPADTYVALSYAVYDADHRTLDLATGGQLTPLLLRDGVVSFLEAHHYLPLGIVSTVPYSATHTQLQPGDTVLFYTDGLVEAFSPEQDLFGFDRVKHALAQCVDQRAAATVDHLLAAVRAWQDGTARHDDVTLVVLNVA